MGYSKRNLEVKNIRYLESHENISDYHHTINCIVLKGSRDDARF